jgi:hypothetical protein
MNKLKRELKAKGCLLLVAEAVSLVALFAAGFVVLCLLEASVVGATL